MINMTRGKHEKFELKDICGFKSLNIADPFEVFGFGILAYFTTLRGIMVAMAFMTISFMPVIYLYNRENFLDSHFTSLNLARISLGNLG